MLCCYVLCCVVKPCKPKTDGRSADAAWFVSADWFWHRLDGVGGLDAVAGFWVGHHYAPCVRELVDLPIHRDGAGDQDGAFFRVAAFGHKEPDTAAPDANSSEGKWIILHLDNRPR